MSTHSWYYVVDGARVGPVEESEITRLIDAGTVTAQTLVWREGLDGWVAASEHFAMSSAMSTPGAPPPMPTPAAPKPQFRAAIRGCNRRYTRVRPPAALARPSTCA